MQYERNTLLLDMLKYITLFLVLVALSIGASAQSSKDTYKTEYIYDIDTEEYFKGNRDAKLIVDYYYSEGISTGNRFSYEIMVIDSLIIVDFSSPETDTYRLLRYRKEWLLTHEQQDAIKSVLAKAGLKQKIQGIPRPEGTAHVKQILIARSGKTNVKGYAHEDDVDWKIAQAQEVKESSSIGGDYLAVIDALRQLSVDLLGLLKDVYQPY